MTMNEFKDVVVDDFSDDKIDVVMTVELIKEAMGDEAEEFLQAMEVIDAIIANPNAFHGRKAAVEANRLAALRTKIGVKAQYYKTANKTLPNAKKRNVLMTMFTALEENINTLKILAKIESSIIR
jgi:hypothetical protein